MINAYSYRTGLISAAISVVYYLIAYIVGIDLFTNFWIPSIISIGIIVYMIISLKKIRTMMGGYISFRDGLINFLVMSGIYIVISQFFIYLLTNVIDPEFGIAVNDVVIEKAIGLMEKFGTPEEAIEKALIDMEDEMAAKTTFMGSFITMLKTMIFYIVIGLVTAAIMKRKNSENFETID